MKKMTYASAAMVLVLTTGSAFAANSLNSGSMGLNVPVTTGAATTSNTVTNPIITGRYFVAKDMAVLGGFGFSTGGPSGASTTTFSLLGGMRKYLKTEDFAPFVGGYLSYESTSSNPSSSAMTLAAEAGAEYFLSKQFSVEGKVSFGYQTIDVTGVKSTHFGTSTANLGLNFYF